MAAQNRTLGKFKLAGIPPAPRGVPQIEVTFDIDANGIVNVSAKDKATGKEQKITITSSSGLSKSEVENMMREAESHAEEDKLRRELTDVRNQADSLVYQVEKTLAENKEKVPASEAGRIESALAAVRKASEGEEVAAIHKAMDELQKASHAMAEALYKQAQPGPSGAGTPGGGPSAGGPSGPGGATGDVIDAEVVDDEKKP
jgi:molecular chaperone DnaK